MARVLIPHQSEWFDELKAVGYYGETDLEREIRQHVSSLFPSFYVFPFKASVVSRKTGDTNKPDLAMVRRDFLAWGVIEVELSEHDIKHVLEQTDCFANGNYNAPEISNYIRRQMEQHCNKRVSQERISKLIASELPTVLVIADEENKDWQQHLRAAKVKVCVFQIFKNMRGHHIYRTFGDYPAVPIREVHCRRHPTISNMVEIVGNFEFKNLRRNNQVEVVYDSSLTRWKLLADGGKNYLQFLGKVNPLVPNVNYGLFVDRENKYYFKIN
jgi:hypothetical protein